MAPIRLRLSATASQRESQEQEAQSRTLSFTADDGLGLAELAGEGLALRRGYALRPGWRPVHTHGVFMRGRFQPSGDARPAAPPHLRQGPPTRVLARFSGCDPRLDADDRHFGPRGLAVRFELPQDRTTDLVTISTDRFPATTIGAFVSVSRALSSRLLLRLPRLVWVAVTRQLRGPLTVLTAFAPVSYALCDYYAIHTFVWNRPGELAKDQLVRYRWRSVEGRKRPRPWTRFFKRRDYLERDLYRREGNGVRFWLEVQYADRCKVKPARLRNIAKPLPRRIKWNRIGELCLDRTVTDEAPEDELLLFSPDHLIEGIEPYPGDEMFTARAAVYPASHVFRAGVSR